jgi:hypothetical protein
MKSNEELNKKYSEFFIEPVSESKLQTDLDLIPSVSESIQVLQPKTREFKPIMTEEEFNKIFGDIE